MSETIQADGLADAIMKCLQDYSAEVIDGVKKAEDEVVKECRTNLKADSPVGATRKYAAGWQATVTQDTPTDKTTVIHNKQWYLTHLLENGHATPSGGRTRAYPHIAKNAETASKEFEERAQEAIENGH